MELAVGELVARHQQHRQREREHDRLGERGGAASTENCPGERRRGVAAASARRSGRGRRRGDARRGDDARDARGAPERSRAPISTTMPSSSRCSGSIAVRTVLPVHGAVPALPRESRSAARPCDAPPLGAGRAPGTARRELGLASSARRERGRARTRRRRSAPRIAFSRTVEVGERLVRRLAPRRTGSAARTHSM